MQDADPFAQFNRSTKTYERFALVHDLVSAVTVDIKEGFETSKTSTYFR